MNQIAIGFAGSVFAIFLCLVYILLFHVGTTKFIYDLQGDTVNVASRTEPHGTVGRYR